MTKLLKIIFNRITIVSILIIFQISAMVSVLNEASEYYLYLNIVFIVLSLIYVVKIIKKNIPPSLKLPICILLMLFPVSGIFLYYFSSESKIRKKFLQNIKNQTFTLESLYIENLSFKNYIESENKNAYHESKYISNNTFLPVYANTYNKYFSIGEDFFKSLIYDLKQAKHFIFIEFFIIGEGKLWDEILCILKQKVKEGVKVRVVFDDIGSCKVIPYRYNKKLEKLGISCVRFNPIIPILSLMHNNRDHRKIVVIDGKIAYTGGVNISDEYVNKKARFGHWKDNGIKITGDAVKSFTLMFLETWHHFRNSSEDCSIFLNVASDITDNYCGFVQPYIGDPLSDNDIAKNVYLNIINHATTCINITTPYLSIDNELQNALYMASKNGVKVRILLPHIPDKKYIFYVTQSYYASLIKNGIEIYEYLPGFIHSKTITADEEIGVIGTINFDYRSFFHNYECGVWMYKTNSILNMDKDFNKTISKSLLITNEYIKNNISLTSKILGQVFKIFSPLF